ncbi:MAG: glycoside hydrolase family 2 protein [Armatimonadetes bacterium]|jgi:beta-mannosidase|nr:glycoside hydrolase family 2 protein [Armatimonadota bacterium]
MLSIFDLNGKWKARGFGSRHINPHAYLGPDVDERLFNDAQVPGDIHLDLQEQGIVADPNIGLNALAQRWVEEQIWVYRRNFIVPDDAIGKHVWLVFEAIDLVADIYLNGERIGSHANVFRPCRIDVTGKLKDGDNTLSLHIDSGLYCVAEKPSNDYNISWDHKLHKRSWLRKPQCQFSWDWSPRLINVGIPGNVRLEWTDSARIDSVVMYPELSDDLKSATISVRAFVDCVADEPLGAIIRLRAPDADEVVVQGVELPVGLSRHDVSVTIPDPALWWPKPYGDQPLYEVQCELEIDGDVVDSATRRVGIRSVKINQSPHPVEGRYFIIEINGTPIFAKGGNWVPPDTIYSSIDADRYRKLVDLAVEANFNCLRIWGGGLYADPAFLDACDEAGVMVWHDFIFACSKYPGDDPEFLQNVRAEIEYQVKRLSPHPSLVVWCGNNELEWAAWDWGYDREHSHPDYALYHLEIPRIIAREDPSRPYWPSSPYSLDNINPTSPITGDQHPWHVSLGASGTDFWKYRTDVSRFPNEGGVLGASGLATLYQALPPEHRHVFSMAWEFHDNTCNFNSNPGICYRAMKDWLDLTADELTFEEYAFLSGLLQADGLREYIVNFRRRMFSSASAIFWMYNDTWPQSHGWTIVDYYLRRKLAYHPVRRAFAPISVIATVEEDKILIFGVNDTSEPWQGDVRFGLFEFSGGLQNDRTHSVILPANTSTQLAEIALEKLDLLGFENAGAFALLLKDGVTVSQDRLLMARFKDINWKASTVAVARRGDTIALNSSSYVWGVCLDPECDSPLSDDVFDLLPGIEYVMDWPADKPLPEVKRTGTDTLLDR